MSTRESLEEQKKVETDKDSSPPVVLTIKTR